MNCAMNFPDWPYPTISARLGAMACCLAVATQSLPSAAQAPDAAAVQAVVAESKTLLRTTQQPASVHAYRTAEIVPRVTGYVRELSVDIGDQVKAGQPLAVIDVPELEKQLLVHQAQIARAAAEEQRAAANVDLAAANRANAEAGVLEAEALIAAAESHGAAATAERDRTAAMVARQAVQAKLLDEAQQRSDGAAAEIAGAKAAVTMAQSKVTVAAAAVAAAEAEVAAAAAETQVAMAQRDALQQLVAFATLRAPFDGVIAHRGIDLGDLVRAAGSERDSAGPALVVMQSDVVRIRTAIPESDAPLVDVGDAATVKLAAAGLPAVTGKVARTSGSLDPQTRTLTVEIEAANADGKLLPGMYGEATIVLYEKQDAVVLPASAVRFDAAGGSFVYAIDGDEVRIIPVRVGYDDGKQLEILADVPAGQRVVDAHLRRFRDGDRVRVVE
jgi:RND family efflux transporter MFP subunit